MIDYRERWEKLKTYLAELAQGYRGEDEYSAILEIQRQMAHLESAQEIPNGDDKLSKMSGMTK